MARGDANPPQVKSSVTPARAEARLDVDCMGATGEPAAFDPRVSDTNGGFAADTDGGKAAAAQGAVCDQHILCWPADACPIPTAAGLETDGIVARFDFAALDAHIFVRVDVDAITLAADGDAFDDDVGANRLG